MFKYLLCFGLIGIAYAAGGYNYQTSASAPVPQGLVAPAPAPVQYQAPAAEPAPQASYHHTQHAAPVTEYTKHYYEFTAPEEHHEHHAVQQQPKVTQTIKKHLNVIVIKAPETRVHHRPAPQVVNNVVEETKTHIYVLSKEPSRAAVRQPVVQQQVSHYNHKPEVHYVKYHTPAEAHHKQQEIVQQYGGGNVISLNGNGGSGSGSGFHGAASNVNRQYLAPPANGYIPPRYFF